MKFNLSKKIFNRLLSRSYGKKFLCLNIAKTAGTSLSHLMVDIYKKGEVVTSYGPKAVYDQLGHLQAEFFLRYIKGLGRGKLPRIKAFIGHLPFIDKAFFPFPAEYIVFLRNPVARLISGFAYGLQNRKIPQEFLEFGLHFSCSFERSINYFNPILQVLLQTTIIDQRAAAKLDSLYQSIGFIGITETFDYSCQRLLHYLESPLIKKNYHLNQGNQVAEFPATTLKTIKYKNNYDILFYNKACETLNIERISQNLEPIPLCDYLLESPFSSGDYHADLSCFSAFDQQYSSVWYSSAVLLSASNEYLGYDFGRQQRFVRELKIQIIRTSAPVERFALEASDNGFYQDTKIVWVFEVPADDRLHTIHTGINYAARLWRIRRLTEFKKDALAIATLSFIPEQKALYKNADLARAHIKQITSKYNSETYAKALHEGEIKR